MRNFSLALTLLVILPSLAWAQTGASPSAAPQTGELISRVTTMVVIVFFLFYFMILSPQKAKAAAQKKLISDLKAGEQVLTNAGIIGRVIKNEGEFVTLEIAPNVKVKFEASYIAKKLEKVEAKDA